MTFLLLGSVKSAALCYKGEELSNLNVSSIVQDSLGYIWIGTARGLNRYNGYEQKHYLENGADHTSLLNDNIRELFVTRNGDLFILTRWGVNLYNRKTDNFIQVASEGKAYRCIAEDKEGTIWFGHKEGLSYFDKAKAKICPLSFFAQTGNINHICSDDKGLLWLTLDKGDKVVVFNPKTHRLVKRLILNRIGLIYKGPEQHTLYCVTKNSLHLFDAQTGHDIGSPVPLQGKCIEKEGITSDRCFFFLTNDLELHLYDKKTKSFISNPLKRTKNIFNVTTVFVDRSSNVWIGTFENGLRCLAHNKPDFDLDSSLSSLFKDKFVTCLTGDGRGRMWIGTRREGLWQFNRDSGRSRVLLDNTLKNTNEVVTCCLYDSQKRLWSATRNAVYCYQTDPVVKLLRKDERLKNIRSIVEDKNGNLAFVSEKTGSMSGGVKWLAYNKKEENYISLFRSGPFLKANIMYWSQLQSGSYVFSSFGDNVYRMTAQGEVCPLFENDDVDSLFLKSVIYILEDTKGVLWLGSYGYGLMRYDPKMKKKQFYTMTNGLPSNDVLAITEDEIGRIWMSTSFGLCKISKAGRFTNYFVKEGLFGNQYHIHAVYSEKGILYFTGNHGITSFCPTNIKETSKRIPLILENIETNKRQLVLDSNRLAQGVRLSYKEHSFTVSFLGLDYASAKGLKYKYKLVGYNTSWSVPSVLRTVHFFNVSSGHYQLKVMVSNRDGIWNKKPVTLAITLDPAPWFSRWAICVYILLFVSLIYWLICIYTRFRMNKEKVKMVNEDFRKEKVLTQAKINFFENISHEVRTPLALIYGPFCELQKREDLSAKAKWYMALMSSNIERLMTLVNQVLDFSHLNSETLSLSVSDLDIVWVVRRVIKRFLGVKEDKAIELLFVTEVDQICLLADEDKIEKIVSNLLSNAFKYSPVGSTVRIELNTCTRDQVQRDYKVERVIASDYVQFSIKDSGIGVLEQDVERLFDRFYRSKTNDNDLVMGTGIGLYYIKCLVTKHKGFIKVEQNCDKGMTFKFCLPLDDTVYTRSERLTKSTSTNGVMDKASYVPKRDRSEGAFLMEKKTEEERKPQLLIVEDEYSLHQFLEEILAPFYRIQKAYDGNEGLNKALKIIPDIIISDVMMPGKNGYVFCSTIKTNLSTCHIPIVLLTAKSEVHEQIEGIKAGADVYIPKPFNPDYLISVLQGTLENRKRIQHLITDNGATQESTNEAQKQMSELDQSFLLQLDKQLELQLKESEVSIDQLAAALSFSRSTFYRKMKSLIGLSPHDYIETYRIKKAAKLIMCGKYSISEVADLTGFVTHSHFSAIFKTHFGMSPSDYMNLKK